MRARSISTSRTAVAIAGVGVLSLLAAGCGGGGRSGSDSVTITAPAGGGTPTLTIDAHDVFFTPKTVKAPAGKLKIVYEEKGSQQHTLEIDGATGFKLTVSPGHKQATGTVTLSAGDHAFFCTIPGHRAQGMAGTITAS